MKIKEKEFEDIIQDLKSVAGQLGATVRFEKGDFKGGYCLIKENKVIVINKSANLQRKVMILSAALKELGVDEIYLNPKLREIIEEMGDSK
jgi:Zn-dependent peptidase ImmA (M78 family)